MYACVCAQSRPALCNPKDCRLPGSSFHGFSLQEYWSGLPCPPPGDLPDSGVKLVSPKSPELQVDSLPQSHRGSASTDLKNKQNHIMYLEKANCKTMSKGTSK